MMGTVATALRAYGAEKGDTGNWPNPTQVDLGFVPGDLAGKYFADGDITWTANYDSTVTPSLTYTISATSSITTLNPVTVTLDNTGKWTP